MLMTIAGAAGVMMTASIARSQSAPRPGPPPQPPSPQTSAPDVRRVEAGAVLYKKKGCYECHVDDAQGGPQGPRLGPNPIPLTRFTAYVRNPSGEMPPFTERVLSVPELADIYAFLQARPQPKPVAGNPLLAQ
jgi:mono/diheme cytochrome c family protein